MPHRGSGPVLVASARRAHHGGFRAHLWWLSLLLYYAYTYASYAFSVPFNGVFLVYVAILGVLLIWYALSPLSRPGRTDI